MEQQEVIPSPESVVKDLLRRLSAEAEEPVEKLRLPEPTTPPRTGAGVKIEKSVSNGIEARAMAGLRDAIQSSKALDELVEVVQIAGSLQLEKSSIGDRGTSALARAFRDGNVSNLSQLDLSDNGVTAQGFRELTEVLAGGALAGLEHFDLSHNFIREEGSAMLAKILHIGRLPSLQSLNLSHCYIGDNGIKNLTYAMQSGHFSSWGLQVLNLSANAFGEEGAVELSKVLSLGRLPYLKQLDLSFNTLGEKGTSALAKALKSGQVSGLTHLVLSLCYLGNGVVLIAQAMETGRLPALQALDLSSSYMGEPGSVALADALRSGMVPKLEQLVIAECGITPGALELITEAIEVGKVWGLRDLDLSNNFVNSTSSDANNFTEPDEKYARSYTHVTKDIGSLSLASLIKQGYLQGLQYLNVSHCSMTDEGLIALAEEMEVGHLPKLQRLLLKDNEITSDMSMKALVRALVSGFLPDMQELDLGQNSTGEDLTMTLAKELEDTRSDPESPLVKQLKERLWSSKSPIENFLYKLMIIETRLGVKLRYRQTREATSNVWKNYLQRQSGPLSSSDDDENVESTRIDNKILFNILLVCVWILAVCISKW